MAWWCIDKRLISALPNRCRLRDLRKSTSRERNSKDLPAQGLAKKLSVHSRPWYDEETGPSIYLSMYMTTAVVLSEGGLGFKGLGFWGLGFRVTGLQATKSLTEGTGSTGTQATQQHTNLETPNL